MEPKDGLTDNKPVVARGELVWGWVNKGGLRIHLP